MSLYFSDLKYKEKALNISNEQEKSNKSAVDAMFLLIGNVGEENLSNLCELIKEYLEKKNPDIIISTQDCYELTQGNNIDGKIILDEELKKSIFKLAYKCIESGKPLGTKTINEGKINTSDWIAHSLFEGKLAGQLAKNMGLDVEKAVKLGILHDYGRKKIHNFDHVIRGYEELIDKGWEEEAIGCLTHSFLAGGKCACNEEAEEGFYLDEEGNPCWKEDAPKDDVSEFLDNYTYTDYDIILNIADLMATSKGIVSPSERIDDIATRRNNLDESPNRSYFLAEFTNKLIEVLKKMEGKIPENMQSEIKASKDVTLEQIKYKFEKTSELFYAHYKTIYPDPLKKNNSDIEFI